MCCVGIVLCLVVGCLRLSVCVVCFEFGVCCCGLGVGVGVWCLVFRVSCFVFCVSCVFLVWFGVACVAVLCGPWCVFVVMSCIDVCCTVVA